MIAPFQKIRGLNRDQQGATALEFAILSPVFFALLFGTVQLGILFHAQSGLRSAVEDAARYATTWPKPNVASIKGRIENGRFGLNPENLDEPDIKFSAGMSPNYVTISMKYNISINYVLGRKTIILSEKRTAFTVS